MEWQARFKWYASTQVDRQGVVHHTFEDFDDGRREEWEEHISESPYKDLLPVWVWDTVLDPRD